MSKLNEIINGWANVVKDRIGTLDPNIKQMAENRLLLCNVCHMRINNTCSPKNIWIDLKKWYFQKPFSHSNNCLTLHEK